MHETNKSAHLDIKPDNFVITEEKQVKLIDMAFCVSADKPTFSINGSSIYMAPEVQESKISGMPYDPIKADIFSLGMLIFIIYFGSPPFEQPNSDCKFFRFWLNRGAEKFFQDHPTTQKMYAEGAIPRKFITVLSKMMAVDPMDR